MSTPDEMARTAVRWLRTGVQGSADRAFRLAQWGARRTAVGIETAEPRLTTLAQAGLRATEASCRCVDGLVRQGLQSARGALTDGAERLRKTAQARDLATLYHEQRVSLPTSRARIAREIEATWKIMTSTGRELAEIAQSTREDLAKGSRARRKGPARARKSGRATRRHSEPPSH